MADSKRMQQGVKTMSYIKNAYKYPYITDLINNGGGLSLEYIVDMKIVSFAFDENGAVWQGKQSYDSIEELLNDAEAGVKKWAEERW
jgi:hypothetical protein